LLLCRYGDDGNDDDACFAVASTVYVTVNANYIRQKKGGDNRIWQQKNLSKILVDRTHHIIQIARIRNTHVSLLHLSFPFKGRVPAIPLLERLSKDAPSPHTIKKAIRALDGIRGTK
jgi:hypothetical protein